MAQFVDQIIAGNKVAVFSKTYCPYCVKAKNVLAKYDINGIRIVELDELEDSSQVDVIQDYLNKITGARTVPRVFINGKCIGGGDDTARLDRDNKLKELLKNAGALTD
jgi:glutaredoxin 3